MLITNAINKFILIAQIAVSYLVLMATYTLIVLLDTDFGIDGVLGFLLLHPLLGSLISLLTILLCYFAGLSLRRNPNLNLRMQQYYPYFIAGAVLGLILILVSCTDAMSHSIVLEDDGIRKVQEVPDPELAISGWLITAFCIMHIFPQKLIKDRIQAMLGKLNGKQVIDISDLQKRDQRS